MLNSLAVIAANTNLNVTSSIEVKVSRTGEAGLSKRATAEYLEERNGEPPYKDCSTVVGWWKVNAPEYTDGEATDNGTDDVEDDGKRSHWIFIATTALATAGQLAGRY